MAWIDGLLKGLITESHPFVSLFLFLFFMYFYYKYLREDYKKTFNVHKKFLIIDIIIPLSQLTVILLKILGAIYFLGFLSTTGMMVLLILGYLIIISPTPSNPITIGKFYKKSIFPFLKRYTTFKKKNLNPLRRFLLDEAIIGWTYLLIVVLIIFYAPQFFNEADSSEMRKILSSFIFVFLPYILIYKLLKINFETGKELVGFGVKNIIRENYGRKLSMNLLILKKGIILHNFDFKWFYTRRKWVYPEKYTAIERSIEKLQEIVNSVKLFRYEEDSQWLNPKLKDLKNNIKFEQFTKFVHDLNEEFKGDREAPKLIEFTGLKDFRGYVTTTDSILKQITFIPKSFISLLKSTFSYSGFFTSFIALLMFVYYYYTNNEEQIKIFLDSFFS